MKELKTLKDLDTAADYTPLSRTHYEDFVAKDDLKAEAVKWVKSIDNPLEDRDNMEKLALLENTQEEAENCLFGARRFLIHFFNLTEEDLKCVG